MLPRSINLLSTTVSEMTNVINELQNKDLGSKVKIIIGGSPTSVEFAKEIGADAFARDTIAGVRICIQ